MIYFSWATQIILAIISFLWLIPYYIAFKVGNRKYMSKTLDLSCNNRYTLMYYSGFFISILWYIMPFLNQPRFKLNIFSLFDIKVILLENVLYNIILIALIGYFMSVWGTKVVNCNLQATKDRFLHPSKLITCLLYTSGIFSLGITLYYIICWISLKKDRNLCLKRKF